MRPLPDFLKSVWPQLGQSLAVGTSHVIKPHSAPRSQA